MESEARSQKGRALMLEITLTPALSRKYRERGQDARWRETIPRPSTLYCPPFSRSPPGGM